MRRYRKTREETVIEYFEWLLEKVDFDNDHCGYEELLRYLHSVEFTSRIPKDENRVIDGLNLRDEFMCDRNIDGYIEGPCSVLEMLVAFSIRIEMDITGDPGNDDLSRWFWVMLDNLGLLKYDDRHFDEEEVEEIVNIFLERKYSRDGRGGLFPLFHPKTNQRETELWYQMQRYLTEHSRDW